MQSALYIYLSLYENQLMPLVAPESGRPVSLSPSSNCASPPVGKMRLTSIQCVFYWWHCSMHYKMHKLTVQLSSTCNSLFCVHFSLRLHCCIRATLCFSFVYKLLLDAKSVTHFLTGNAINSFEFIDSKLEWNILIFFATLAQMWTTAGCSNSLFNPVRIKTLSNILYCL